MQTPGLLTVEFFFSFRSPYSYLAAPRAFGLQARFAVEIVYRGVRPMVTRGVPLPAAKRLNIIFDAAREAKRLDMPFGELFDPLGDGALRCLYVAERAVELGCAPRFVLAASRAIWAEAADVTDDTVLRRLSEQAGVSWDIAREALSDAALHARVEQNAVRLGQLGHWGVPTCYFNGELFWGQDRLVDLEVALRAAGVAELGAGQGAAVR
jgi:2-hydroxychromene-2-carboxylate isomerase